MEGCVGLAKMRGAETRQGQGRNKRGTGKVLTPLSKVHRTPTQEQHHPVKKSERCR